MISTTLNRIKAESPCAAGWRKLLAHLGKTMADDEALPLSVVLEANGFDDTLWAFRALDGEDLVAAKMFTLDVAERALRFVPEGEDRPRIAIETARRYLTGAASEGAVRAAYAARAADADAAARASHAAADAAADAARAEREKQTEMLKELLS